jgi:hypothetical protein
MNVIDARTLDPIARIRVSGPGGRRRARRRRILTGRADVRDGRRQGLCDVLGPPHPHAAGPSDQAQRLATLAAAIQRRRLLARRRRRGLGYLGARRAPPHRGPSAPHGAADARHGDQAGWRGARTAPGKGYIDMLAVPSLTSNGRIPARYGRWSRFSDDGRTPILGDHEGRAQLYDVHHLRAARPVAARPCRLHPHRGFQPRRPHRGHELERWDRPAVGCRVRTPTCVHGRRSPAHPHRASASSATARAISSPGNTKITAGARPADRCRAADACPRPCVFGQAARLSACYPRWSFGWPSTRSTSMATVRPSRSLAV